MCHLDGRGLGSDFVKEACAGTLSDPKRDGDVDKIMFLFGIWLPLFACYSGSLHPSSMITYIDHTPITNGLWEKKSCHKQHTLPFSALLGKEL
jgi:hypothetical protein